MRASAVVSEAWRNIVSGTSRPLLIAFLAAVVLGGIAAGDVRTIVGLSTQATEFRESGAAVEIMQAPAAISGQRCDALGALPGVLGAGATRKADEQATPLTAPRAGIATVEATPGLAGVLGIENGAVQGVWIEDSAREALGTSQGGTIPTSRGPVKLVASYSYPQDASDRTLAYTLIVPVPAEGAFDACWVLAWPPSPDLESLIRGTYFGDPTGQSSATYGQLNTRLGAVLDGPTLFQARSSSISPAIAAIFGLVLGAGAVWARRLEIASALHAQLPKPALVTQLGIELLVVMLSVVVIVLPVTYFLAARGNPDPMWPAWSAGLRIVAAGLLATLVGGLLTAAGTSEKRLFRYFKDR